MKRLLVGFMTVAMLIAATAIMQQQAFAADTASVAVSATVVGTCKFNSGGTMAFGNLDPASGADVNATLTQPAFWCTKGSSYTLSDDDGLYESGTTHRVKHAASADYIPYTFTYTSTGTGTGRTSPITMNIAGTIAGTDYVDAPVGGYADTVVLSVNP